jgi:hypothetical protein
MAGQLTRMRLLMVPSAWRISSLVPLEMVSAPMGGTYQGDGRPVLSAPPCASKAASSV